MRGARRVAAGMFGEARYVWASIATRNRWGGQHLNLRERTRRLRQAARNEERQRARVHARIEQASGAWMPPPHVVGISRRERFIIGASVLPASKPKRVRKAKVTADA